MQAVYPGSIGTLGEPFQPHPVMTTSSASTEAFRIQPPYLDHTRAASAWSALP